MIHFLIAIGLSLIPGITQACSTCYGASDAPATQGMNWAIITLLGVTGGMLASVGTMIIRLKNRAKNLTSKHKEL
ncbi:MAG: hypothetical protein HN657_04160 [Candidatus Marinimicrobia bacterium]|jgi:hypothetical protein|nr:hypothetical protein [Candidatus Neomarinimicrobiota bacterium]MBT3497189.1 hypothetical protein [Candidatus Neomarinimicrobiota bacterium]MBT3692909.1 hypothetical protein [Candidatus Neomarinimicrobiota bacterium]MBT3731651.1 hypothetical protein [Candidatus Neomarinimicrobiota bacterium]MBT4144403.1 hypothetical protein [Candidatus Neomarinimicrobiota bacterium]